MVKKNKGTFSYIETQQALETISTTATCESLPYDLLKIFCGYSDTAIARVRDGRGNDAKDGKTILIKKLFAYRPTETTLLGEEDVSDVIEAMQADASITKKNHAYILLLMDTPYLLMIQRRMMYITMTLVFCGRILTFSNHWQVLRSSTITQRQRQMLNLLR